MNQERLLSIILSPHISEKATLLTEKVNAYIFRVAKSATKPEIRDAVEFLFNTKVKSVRIVNVKPKNRTFRNRPGVKSGWKKAYVSLKSDQKLAMLDQ